MENVENIAMCGLYCANCYKFKNGKCPGCNKNTKASWCKIRTCGLNKGINTCAECTEDTPHSCKYYKNPISQLFGFIFNSDRAAGIQLIKDEGEAEFALYLNQINKMAIPRRGKKA